MKIVATMAGILLGVSVVGATVKYGRKQDHMQNLGFCVAVEAVNYQDVYCAPSSDDFEFIFWNNAKVLELPHMRKI